MALVELVLAYWIWVIGLYVVAFVVIAAWSGWDYYRTASRTDFDSDSDSDSDSHNGAGTDTDSHSDADCRANLDRAVNRKSGRRSMVRPGDWPRVGRHDADGNLVLADEKAIA